MQEIQVKKVIKDKCVQQAWDCKIKLKAVFPIGKTVFPIFARGFQNCGNIEMMSLHLLAFCTFETFYFYFVFKFTIYSLYIIEHVHRLNISPEHPKYAAITL